MKCNAAPFSPRALAGHTFDPGAGNGHVGGDDAADFEALDGTGDDLQVSGSQVEAIFTSRSDGADAL